MILREDMIQRSVREHAISRLPSWGYTPGDNLVVRDSFPTADERVAELEQTTLAFGFHFDDGGTPSEMGSTLTLYVHTIELWIFALDPETGVNLANALKHIFRSDYIVNLMNYEEDPPVAIDTMEADKVSVTRQIAPQPRPWDRFVWTTTVKLRDEYMY